MSESTYVVISKLIEDLKRGDDEARGELIECAQRRMDQLTRRMLKEFGRVHRWEHTSDVRQNASLRLWKALRDVTPPTAADFFRLAAVEIRRELIDTARHYFGPEGMGANQESWPKKASASTSLGLVDPVAEETDAEQLASWTEFHESVEKLPDEERAAYDLLWYQGLPQKEAARLLGISVWTLRRHYRHAKLRLHRRLGDGFIS